jgi:chromatin modification-related protein YNG2
MDDPAEIAALCQEYASSLDNVPHEVSHILKEIQHKDSKVQDLLPKISLRESQLRELLNKGSPGAPVSAGGTAGGSANGVGAAGAGGLLTEQDKVRAEKLMERIKLDYRRADEWSAHKEVLSLRLWRIIHAHKLRLEEVFTKIAPGVMNTAESNVAASSHSLGPLPGSAAAGGAAGGSILSAIASAFGVGTSAGGMGMPALSNGDITGSGGSGMKRKAPTHISLAPLTSSPLGSALSTRPANATPSGGRIGARALSSERGTPSAALGSPGGYGSLDSPSRGGMQSPATYGSSAGRPRKSGGLQKSRLGASSSGLANVFSANKDSSHQEDLSLTNAFELDEHGANEGEDEKDENLYCFCQKVSYGEMIGCDSDECKFEWFHLDCVGLSKPLPQVWYCSDCQARMKLKDSSGTVKKEGSVGADSAGTKQSGANKRRKKA